MHFSNAILEEMRPCLILLTNDGRARRDGATEQAASSNMINLPFHRIDSATVVLFAE